MSHTVLRVPESALLAGYVAALERGWSPNTMRAEAAQASAERTATENAAQVEARLKALTQSGENTLENARATVEVRAREIAESALRAIEAASQRLEDIEAQSAARLTDVVEQASQAMQRLEERLNQVTGRIATLTGAGLGAIAALCDRATAILGYDPSSDTPAAPLPGSFADLVASAERAVAARQTEYSPTWCETVERIDTTEPLIGPGEEAKPAKASRRAGRSVKAHAKPRRAKGRSRSKGRR